jgi:hypothetical protein
VRSDGLAFTPEELKALDVVRPDRYAPRGAGWVGVVSGGVIAYRRLRTRLLCSISIRQIVFPFFRRRRSPHLMQADRL